MFQAANPGRHVRRALSVVMLVWMWGNSSCVGYETWTVSSETEVIAEGARERTVTVDKVRDSSLLLSATESWDRELIRTTINEGEFEVEWTLELIAEAPEMIVLSPLLLAIDLLALVITGPVAVLEAMVSGTEVDYITKHMTEPFVGLAANVTSGSWSADGVTDAQGRVLFDLREPAAQALCGGNAMSYRVTADDEPPVAAALSLSQTLACAALPDSEQPAERFAYWQGLVVKSQPSKVRELLEQRADRVNPTTLARYQKQHGLPAAMTLLHVDYYRAHSERCASAQVDEDYAGWSHALALMGGLMAPHDEARATALKAQSLTHAAAYVAHYYAERSLRSTPSFMIKYCARNLAVARQSKDHRSAAIFSSVLAARAGNISRLEHVELGGNDTTVAGMHNRARKEVQRQLAQAAYAAEVARIKSEEEAWHYRYLNGRGGSGGRGVSSTGSNSSESSYRGSRGPSVGEQARAHQSWLQTQKHNAANRNRAFDQFDRGN